MSGETEKILFETEVSTGKSETSVKSLRAQMKALRDELAGLDPASEAFTKVATKAGELQEKIKFTSQAIDNFNPEKKFQAFATVIGGTAHAFEGLQGATALFGAENKNLEAAILKTQGAMALANGLNGLLGMRNELKQAAIVIKDQVVGAFGSLKAAIASTGIGLLVLALVEIVANWKAITKAIEDAFPAFKKVEEFFVNFKSYAMGTLKAVVAGFSDVGLVIWKLLTGHPLEAIKEAKNIGHDMAVAFSEGYQKQLKEDALKASIEERKNKLDLLEAQGKDVKAARLKLAQDELSLLEKGSEEYNKKLIEVEKIKTAIRKEENDKKIANEKKLAEEYQRIAEVELKLHLKELEDRKQLQKDFDTARQNQIDEDNRFTAFQAEQEKERLEIAKREADGKIAMLDATANAFTSFASIAGQQTETGKILASIGATISMIASAQKAYESAFTPVAWYGSPALGAIAAAAAVASGLANIAAINAVQVPGGSGKSASISTPSVSIPKIPSSSNTTLLTNGNSPVLTRSLDVKTNKVFVVETDITDSQKRVKGIQDKATIK